MGLGIAIIVFGLLAGGISIAAPKGVWWATQSWKFRNPEANEPSDAAYALTRLGGVVLVVISLGVGLSVISDERKSAADERAKQAEAEAEANFVAPPPENRGTLPIVGYFGRSRPDGQQFVDVYYAAPQLSYSPGMVAISGDDHSHPCYAQQKVMKLPDGGVTVDVELFWAPEKLSDQRSEGTCRFGRSHRVDFVSVGNVRPDAPILTDAAIVDRNAAEIRAAAPGNVVPRLAEEPRGYQSYSTVYDHGAVPIVGYQFENGSVGIRYVKPADRGRLRVRGVDDRANHDACELTPIITGLGTPTVTVDLRLRWSDPNDYYDDDDEKKCVPTSDDGLDTNTEWIKATELPTILTDGPIADRDGTIVAPAAPGNRVPPA